MPLHELPSLPQRLDTERLFLRPYRGDDAPWYYEMAQRNRTHLAWHESGNDIFNIHCESDAAAVVCAFAQNWHVRSAFPLGVFLRETEEFVGQIYLGVTNAALPALNLGFFADCTHVNQGYLTEAVRRALAFAFNDLGAHRVGLWCDDTNTPSRRIAERCGFRLEGQVREDKRHPDGSITGSLCYGMLQRDYRAYVANGQPPIADPPDRDAPRQHLRSSQMRETGAVLSPAPAVVAAPHGYDPTDTLAHLP